jgi:hypothetical protein
MLGESTEESEEQHSEDDLVTMSPRIFFDVLWKVTLVMMSIW